ncbi:MAG: LptF/LptG family permease [Desulfobulbaceae bacterium]|nr:LptF/LptG family permease [Desulfobulbaceae bacterium]
MNFPYTFRRAAEALPGRINALPLLLYSYIAGEMLAPFFASFIILYSVFFLVRLVPLLDIVLDLKIGPADFIRMFSYIFPYMLVYVIPMASMTGVILAFTRMTNEREILAMKASGVSLRQLLPPVIIVAMAISMLTAFFSISLIPAGNMAMKQLLFQLAKEKIDKGLQQKTFTEALGDLVVYVDNIDNNEQWQGVYISDMRNRKQPMIIMAERGSLVANIEQMVVTIVLGDGTIHNTNVTENQTIRFVRYQLNIPIPSPTRVHGDDVTVMDRSSMTQQQLLQAARDQGEDAHRAAIFLTKFHDRLSLPVGCFILSILGLPLGLQSSPGRKAIGIPLGLAFFVLYYVLNTLGTILSEELIVPVLVGMWLPNILLAGLTVLIFRRVEQEKPIISFWIQNRVVDFFDRYIASLIGKVKQGSARLLRWRRGRHEEDYFDAPEIRANVRERVYHYPNCDLYNCRDCTIRFKDARIAEEAGFTPCGYCHPDQGSN